MIAITKEACCSHGASKVRAAAIPTSVRLLLEPQTTANVLLFVAAARLLLALVH